MSSRTIPLAPLSNKEKHTLVLSRQGLGCLPMSGAYGDVSGQKHEQECLQTITRAIELGINFFDVSWLHQPFGQSSEPPRLNEIILGEAIATHGREKFKIASNCRYFCKQPGDVNEFKPRTVDTVIRAQLDKTLSNLGTDHIDLYIGYRSDLDSSVEEAVHCLKALVSEGKVKHIGLSECTPLELRKAHLIHPISALHVEWNLQSRSFDTELLRTARELGVGIIAYSPLDRGLLGNSVHSRDELHANDWRLKSPRFSETNLQTNTLTPEFLSLAAAKKLTPSQLSLAWLHQQGEDVFPIPGTKNVQHLEENVEAVFVKLSQTEVRQIEQTVSQRAAGDAVPFAGPIDTKVKIGMYGV